MLDPTFAYRALELRPFGSTSLERASIPTDWKRRVLAKYDPLRTTTHVVAAERTAESSSKSFRSTQVLPKTVGGSEDNTNPREEHDEYRIKDCLWESFHEFKRG